MKPVAIFQHTEVGHPGAALSILDQLGIPWTLIRIVDGEAVPASPDAYSGLIFMGGMMGVNDGIDWIEEEARLIRQAAAQNIPVAGHCLGSQILAYALGAKVSRNAIKEIGWQTIQVASSDAAAQWFGMAPQTECTVFQWHGDTFDIPPSGILLASSTHCRNQAYLVDGIHLGMQFHLEMTPVLIEMSLHKNGAELQREVDKGSPATNTVEEVRHDMVTRTATMHALLTTLYRQWIRHLRQE